ncbi:MAG: protein translocase subunit SecD [Patescibacteria group bacterium]
MSSKRKLILNFVLILILFTASAYAVYPKNQGIDLNKYGIKYSNDLQFHLGLDLQGGTHLVYQADLSQIKDADKESAMNGVRDVVERRINSSGVAEPNIQVSHGDRLIVELAGVKDVNEAIKMIGETPMLEFKEEMTDEEKAALRAENSQIPEEYLSMYYYKSTGLDGTKLKRADVSFDPQTYEPEVQLQFNDEGTKLFSEITSRNIGKKVAIFLDQAPISIPTVQVAITDGKAVISGNFTNEEARTLVQRLNAGALPVPISLLSQQTVDASLGQDSVDSSVAAGIIGFILLSIFMIAYYRLPGLLAVIALLLYTLMSLTIFKLIPVTLTLSGIAGFILSIGMAVDANVLIFERTKEELRKGKTLINAIDEGFKRAWSSIFDSNTSTLITCSVLIYFGAGTVRGFAVTLAIGVLLSMFSAVTVTKNLLRITTTRKIFRKPWLFGIRNKK